MTLAIMQPYLFPYIGYFQLIKAVDEFVFYDDVNFIKQGWINRNRILNGKEALLFTVPLENASSFLKINEININLKQYDLWKVKFLKTIELNYKKAPFYSEVSILLADVFNAETFKTIADMAILSVTKICNYLDIKTKLISTSAVYNNDHLSGRERVVDICRQVGATHYINPIGGKELYDYSYFQESGLKLNFINSLPVEYKQFKDSFVPWLSIIDILMFNSTNEINSLLKNYELI